MRPALILGILLISGFVISVLVRHYKKVQGFATEGFATESFATTSACGTNKNDVFDSSSKGPTGPLKNCAPGTPPFYRELARIKGTKVVDPKLYLFKMPGGTDPTKNMAPGSAAYFQTLKKVGTSVLDPDNWSLKTAATPKVAAPSASSTGKVPAPAGTGVVPNTMPGSTTNNSTTALASAKDLLAFRDTLTTYNALFDKNILKASRDTELQFLHANAISYLIKVQAQIDTGSIVDSLNFITSERAKYEKVILDLRQGVFPAQKTAAKKILATAPGKKDITLADLENAIIRAQKEKKRIDDLRTSSGDLKKRSMTLEMVILDLQDIVGRIRRGELKISQLPFTMAQLTKFLMEVGVPTSKITPLPGLKKAQKPTAAANKAGKPGTYPLPQNNNAAYINALQQFRTATQDLSWDVHIGYDPETTIHRKTLERLAHITNQIESGKVSGPVLKALMLELQALKQKAEKHKRHRSSQKQPISAYEAFGQPFALSTSEPLMLDNKVPVRQPLIQNLATDAPSTIRPGYEPTNESIANRASLASFDYSKAGGPDYKLRAEFLCNQIRDAGLGDNREFGCVGQSEVGPEYSWRGNYKMVCSRLSHTWGDWYPEMFGCPKEDIAYKQTPVIHLEK